jgi:hypothetical protein
VNPLTALVQRPERLVSRSITVGCRLRAAVLRTCRATVLRGGKRIGRATKTLNLTGKRTANVRVPLNRASRRLIGKSIAGVAVQVRLLALTFTPPSNLTASRNTRVVAPRVNARPRLAVFKAGSAKRTKAGAAFLRKVAKQVGRAKRIVCTAHPDAGLSRVRGRALSRSRAAAGCTVLRKAGLKAKFTRRGSTGAADRRIQLTILR